MLFFGTTSPSRSPLVQGWRTNHKPNRRYLSLRTREREKWREHSPEHTSSSKGTWGTGRILQVQCKKQYSKQCVIWDTDDIWMYVKLFIPCKGNYVSWYYSLTGFIIISSFPCWKKMTWFGVARSDHWSWGGSGILFNSKPQIFFKESLLCFR